jgi:hypothetical protein
MLSFLLCVALSVPGYSKDAKLLIVHGDDLGFAHSVNAATIQALESGAINSASLMPI